MSEDEKLALPSVPVSGSDREKLIEVVARQLRGEIASGDLPTYPVREPRGVEDYVLAAGHVVDAVLASLSPAEPVQAEDDSAVSAAAVPAVDPANEPQEHPIPEGKFWRRGGAGDFVEIQRQGDNEDDLLIEIEDGSDYARVVLPRAAESLLQWLDRSRGPEPVQATDPVREAAEVIKSTKLGFFSHNAIAQPARVGALTDEMVERAARTHFEYTGVYRWDRLLEDGGQEVLRAATRAALVAALSPSSRTEGDEEFDAFQLEDDCDADD